MHCPRFEDNWKALDGAAGDTAWVRDILRMDGSWEGEDHSRILQAVVHDALAVGRNGDEEVDNVGRIHNVGEEVHKVAFLVVDNAPLGHTADVDRPDLDCSHKRSFGCCSLNSYVALASWVVPPALPTFP